MHVLLQQEQQQVKALTDQRSGFEAWLKLPGPRMESFVYGIDYDSAAVRAALTEPWSTSPVEEHIHRLKTIKRQMYGRAKDDLLRQQVLAAA